MSASSSARITNKGKRVLLRLDGQFYDLSQDELRTLPTRAAGWGITIDNDRLSFEFAADEQVVELSARQLQKRLAKQTVTKK